MCTTRSRSLWVVFYWLDTGKLFEEQNSCIKVAEISLLYSRIAYGYVFADAQGMPQLKNAAIGLLAAKIAAAGLEEYVSDNTREYAPARKLLIYELVECIDIYGDIIIMQLHDELLKEAMFR
jgi:hypothetical protein